MEKRCQHEVQIDGQTVHHHHFACVRSHQTGAGVVAEAELDSAPELKKIPYVKNPDQYPWAFKTKNPRYFFEKPVVIDCLWQSVQPTALN